MFFEIENTPEHVRRARRKAVVPKNSPKDECPRLILAPFSKPPQVVFEDVLIGTTCERLLEIFNPSKKSQQITLGRALPPGLIIPLLGEQLEVEPETCYCLTMLWTPIQPTALRETIRFVNEDRGRYDIIIVLKSAMNVKGKKGQPKGFKTSPGKIKKKTNKKSPVSIFKKKAEIIYNNTTKIKKSISVTQTTNYKTNSTSNKENVSNFDDYLKEQNADQCPFDSPTSLDWNFDTSEIFSNMRKTHNQNILQNTYEKPTSNLNSTGPTFDNVLKPSNKCNVSASDLFDHLTFTPLKTEVKITKEKLEKGPKIILSMNSDNEFDDSLNEQTVSDSGSGPHSIMCVTSTHPPNKWLTHHHPGQINTNLQIANVPNKIPNTSSPKELSSPNFSINTEFSRISELSFFPQRCSTERKQLPKVNNETHEVFDDMNLKLNSDTYTKDSPNTPVEHITQMFLDNKQPQYFLRDQPKMCRQTLFREYHMHKEVEKKHLNIHEGYLWQNEMKPDNKSPTRSLTPPLQSIPEESTHFYDTQVLDKTDQHMNTYTINRTFEKVPERPSLSTSRRQTWSKKLIKAEPELWKVPIAPPRKSLKPKASISGKESIGSKMSSISENNKSINQNISLNQMGNVYSQSFTVDPFLSTTYFYDEEAVDKLEVEFKRWLNCILTPPADLDSNVEQKIDVGKAWLENRNKEVPAAPTKEQVCSAYHNSHRLESLRRSARALLMSADIAQVIQKLNAQIEKKLIAVRTDRNIHLDVGLQKTIMELLLSYNPLWLRIGLEAIYGCVLPLRSNSDIEGLTTFIVQRMFKNPHLKNKHSKSNAPNMLLPAYMEAIKKFTLKKFFMLIFFLDQAKQRKLIHHDPCLFCRNAICKESREVIIRFTREVIAGIGDITKHLRPLGYVVSHKQSYLDEYKYAVHNIALDIRDGVRLTKVMEIILIKNGLLKQLRTPAISRLQKIHNVHVALSALKEASFFIVGDISANDIADGHREKTLSLLWQIIHVFRAPLFEKAANVIQTWWKKKYQVIVEKRKEEERILQQKYEAASIIQYWWRNIQYNRLVEQHLQQVTTASVVIQKYCRMWICRTRLRKIKTSVLKIEDWLKSTKMIKEARETLIKLRQERETLRYKSAVVLQSYVRRWLCVSEYKRTLRKIVLLQGVIRSYFIRKWYLQLRKSVINIQTVYRGKLLMKGEMKKYAQIRNSAIVIQSYYRMTKKRKAFKELKQATKLIEDKYIAVRKMRVEFYKYKKIVQTAILLQARFRGKRCRINYLRQRNLIINAQRRLRAQIEMKKERLHFIHMKNACIILQTRLKAYLCMKNSRQQYLKQRESAITIQKCFRCYILMKAQRRSFTDLRDAAIVLQRQYRSLLYMRKDRAEYLKLRHAALCLQRQYRANILMRISKQNYELLRKMTIAVQRRYRAHLNMLEERAKYMKWRASCIIIQNAYRAYILGNLQKENYLKQRNASITIQRWFRNCKITKQVKFQYQQHKQACVTIQRIYRAYYIGKHQRQEYIQIKIATVKIQKFYRCYKEMKTVRKQYVELKKATVNIQRYYKSYLDTKKLHQDYLKQKAAAKFIQNYYRHYTKTQEIKREYCLLRSTTIYIQRVFRNKCITRKHRNNFLHLKNTTVKVQQIYRAKLAMKVQSEAYTKLKAAVLTLQRRFRAQYLMKQERTIYLNKLRSCIVLQAYYRAYSIGKKQRKEYLKLKIAAIVIQRSYKSLLLMRKERNSYQTLRTTVIMIQHRYRAKLQMLPCKAQYQQLRKACITIQNIYRARLIGLKQKSEYIKIISSTISIQRWYRSIICTRKVRHNYLQLRSVVVQIQCSLRKKLLMKRIQRREAAKKIQIWYRSLQKRNVYRKEYVQLRKSSIIIQSAIRMFLCRKKYLLLKRAVITIQRHYRAYDKTVSERRKYVQLKISTILLQSYVRRYIYTKRFLKLKAAVTTIQAAYKLKIKRELIKKQRDEAAVCIQKNVRRYLVQSWYQCYMKQVVFIQKTWRWKLLTRLARCEFLQKRKIIVKLQALMRGYLVRKQVQIKREDLIKKKEELRRNHAASKIQALFRGHKARMTVSADRRVAELRKRWREGALESTQETMKERNEEAMEVLRNMSGIESVIRAFRSLELLTEVFPMLYDNNASSVVRRMYIYMSVTNRSLSSIEVLKSAASALVNLTRYRITGPKIYARERITPILIFMRRYSNSETHLFLLLATYLWLFSKYEEVKEDLTQFLREPENHKVLVSIKANVERMKRMASNSRTKFLTPQGSKTVTHTENTSKNLNYSSSNTSNSFLMPTVKPDYGITRASNSRTSFLTPQISKTISHTENTPRNLSHSFQIPSLEPDYGITRVDKPRYFEDPQLAVLCLFQTYNLH